MPTKVTKATGTRTRTSTRIRTRTKGLTSSPFFPSSSSSSSSSLTATSKITKAAARTSTSKPKAKSNSKSSSPNPLRTPVPRSPFSTKIPSHYLPPLLAHPAPLIDILAPSLLLIFIGTNPGLLTAYTGHTYSSPTNSFWKLLHASNLTPTANNLPLLATEDRTIPRRFLLGNTNIVERATRNQEELGKEEMVLGAGRTVRKISRWRPEAVCVVGKGVWEAFVGWGKRCIKTGERSGFGGLPGSGKKFQWGWQVDGEGREVRMGVVERSLMKDQLKEERKKEDVPQRSWLGEVDRTEVLEPPVYEHPWEGARVYVVPSTSGLVTMPFAQKLEIWREVGEWVCKRREEKGFICS